MYRFCMLKSKMKCFLILLFCGITLGKDATNSSTFIATNEWQVVKEGQVIPQGLHIRINLSTGLKEAKLLVENKSNALSITKNENIENESKFNNQELKEALQNIKNENPSHDDK
ncbi:nucleotide exchange factor SIL1-like [Ctenocephalides felis]|nr:nucleotide exchange factor SIL1-like [Ctenocephalides felis]